MPDDTVLLLERYFDTAFAAPDGIQKLRLMQEYLAIDRQMKAAAPIRVAFFDDRIEVENPGILLPGMTIEDMKQGISKIRNPVKELLAKQLIEYTVPDKPNSRLQKYRLTALGKSLLATEGNRHES